MGRIEAKKLGAILSKQMTPTRMIRGSREDQREGNRVKNERVPLSLCRPPLRWLLPPSPLPDTAAGFLCTWSSVRVMLVAVVLSVRMCVVVTEVVARIVGACHVSDDLGMSSPIKFWKAFFRFACLRWYGTGSGLPCSLRPLWSGESAEETTDNPCSAAHHGPAFCTGMRLGGYNLGMRRFLKRRRKDVRYVWPKRRPCAE